MIYDDTVQMNDSAVYPIQTVALRTGLSSHVIRAWERRYSIVSPERVGGRRLYTEADVSRLSLLKSAVDRGHRIGTVAGLSTDELREIVSRERGEAATEQCDTPTNERVRRAVAHAARTDARLFEAELFDAVRTYGSAGVVEAFIFPVLREMGTRWRTGRAEIAEEHLVTSVIRTYLSARLQDLAPPADAPKLVVAAPAGELHDIGCLAGAVRAQEAGWQALFLGANTPAESIVHVVTRASARGVLVVVTMEESTTAVTRQLEAVAAGVSESVAKALAGSPSEANAERARSLDFSLPPTMAGLDEFLHRSAQSGGPI
jgi:MerR family transcriptional regulator, light-induced transcriptional regulator